MLDMWAHVDLARAAITRMEIAAMAYHPEKPDIVTVQTQATIASEAIGAFIVAFESDQKGQG